MTTETKGFVTNCYIHQRHPEVPAIFHARKDGVMIAMLDRYAVVPIEVLDPGHPDHETAMRHCREWAAEKARSDKP